MEVVDASIQINATKAVGMGLGLTGAITAGVELDQAGGVLRTRTRPTLILLVLLRESV
jgi:hypothetical protein